MSEPQLLARRRGVVLGVSSENSIGYACARTLTALGAEVAITSRASHLAHAAPMTAGFASHLHADADDEPSIAAAFARLAASGPRLDFLVHTWMHVDAAVTARPLIELSREDFNRVLDVGAHSLVTACKHALPLLSASPSPRVVALTSASSHRMTPGYHVAGIAKAALESTVAYLAYELGPRGILCNAVSFSLIATDGAVALVGDKNASATRAVVAKRAPTRRAAEPAEVAEAVAWLCSERAANLTGEILTIDGGYARSYF